MKTEALDICELKFHKIADKHPRMNSHEMAGLAEDIALRGQQVPITLFRGRVVDGRHRLWAIKENGGDTINCHSLPNNMPLKDVEAYVMGTEKRRHQTTTQKACAAYLEWAESGGGEVTFEDQGKKYSVDPAVLSKCKKVSEKLGVNVIKGLKSNIPQLVSIDGKRKTFTNVSRLYNAISKKTAIEEARDTLKEVKINRTKIEMDARAEFGRLSEEGYKYFMLVMRTLDAERVIGH